MATFKDSVGETWLVELDLALAKKARHVLDIDILSLAGKGFSKLQSLMEDPVALCDLLFLCVEGQAAERGLTSEDFGRRLAGEAIEAATLAFLEALGLFFPSRAARLAMEKIVAAAKRAFQISNTRAETSLSEIGVDALADKILARLEMPTSGEPSPSPPESSKPTQAVGSSAT